MSEVADVTIFRFRSKINGGRRETLLQTIKGVDYAIR